MALSSQKMMYNVNHKKKSYNCETNNIILLHLEFKTITNQRNINITYVIKSYYILL